MNDIPDDVREYLERHVNEHWSHTAKDLLAKYPRSQPEPAWQAGDVALRDGAAWARGPFGDWLMVGLEGRCTDRSMTEAELVIRAGRRVHPPQFAEHAAWLADLAERADIEDQETADHLAAIAADLAGDNDD
jgi:hypothetical protein